MSIEVEDSELTLQRILLDSILASRGSVDDAALARMLQQQEDALIQTTRTPTHIPQFGNGETPSTPIIIDNEDEDIMRALEESLRVIPVTPSTNTPVTHVSGATTEKNRITSSTIPNLIQYISSTHPSTPSTTSPQIASPTTPTYPLAPLAPRTASTVTSTTSSAHVDGLASMLDSLHITTERAKNNKPATTINTARRHTNNLVDTKGVAGRNTNTKSINTTNTTDTSNATNAASTTNTTNTTNAAYTANTANTATNTTNTTRMIDSNSTVARHAITGAGNAYGHTERKILKPRRMSRTPASPPAPDTTSVPLSPPPSLPDLTIPQLSLEKNLPRPPSALPRVPSNPDISRPYAYTTYHTSPTNSNINIAADLSAPLMPSLPNSNPHTTNSTNFGKPTTNYGNASNYSNMYNNYSTNLHFAHLQQQQRSAYVPPSARTTSDPASAASPTLAPLSPTSSSLPLSPHIPTSPPSTTPAEPQRARPTQRSAYQPSYSGNAGIARRGGGGGAYFSYVGRLGSASDYEPPRDEPEPTSYEDDEALAERLQMQEALELQQEYDLMESPSNFRHNTVAQMLRQQREWRYADSGSDYSDDEVEDENDVDRMTYEELLALEERIGHVPRGASKTEIEVCPKFTLTPEHSFETKTCLVCHDDIVVGNELRRLPCLHMYHVDCIDTWLAQKPTCPVCLHTIKKD
jgi:hypothetical protein